MSEFPWHPFNKGLSITQPGSESGQILRDEEHPLGARITLECSAQSAPFAITCGIYGWMVHTRFFGREDEALEQYKLMRSALGALLEKSAEAGDDAQRVLQDGAIDFVEAFP